MRFDKKKFSANAAPTCRKLITEEHRDALDGKEVVNGQIEYTVNEKFFNPPSEMGERAKP